MMMTMTRRTTTNSDESDDYEDNDDNNDDDDNEDHEDDDDDCNDDDDDDDDDFIYLFHSIEHAKTILNQFKVQNALPIGSGRFGNASADPSCCSTAYNHLQYIHINYISYLF